MLGKNSDLQRTKAGGFTRPDEHCEVWATGGEAGLWQPMWAEAQMHAYAAAREAAAIERCAQVCESEASRWDGPWAEPADACAAAIRALKSEPKP